MHVVKVKKLLMFWSEVFFVISFQKTLKGFSDKAYCNNDINNANGSF